MALTIRVKRNFGKILTFFGQKKFRPKSFYPGAIMGDLRHAVIEWWPFDMDLENSNGYQTIVFVSSKKFQQSITVLGIQMHFPNWIKRSRVSWQSTYCII